MSTPPRLVELRCPACGHSHWEIDCDFRASYLRGEPDLVYAERSYSCPACAMTAIGWMVGERSPPEFFLQPHSMYQMDVPTFAHWVRVLQRELPGHHRLPALGVGWYPGRRSHRHETRLAQSRSVGIIHGYRLFISNPGPRADRIRVGVQRHGEAHFLLDPGPELEQVYYGFDEEELDAIVRLILKHHRKVRAAWKRFVSYATESQREWRRRLGLEVLPN